MLPEPFLNRMKEMLDGEYEDFLASYEKEEIHSLRLNLLKTDQQEFAHKCNWKLDPVPWSGEGFYYEGEERPGRHPYHEAGVYYIQEASAMAVAPRLEAKPGEKILDLCAAPGGKSSQIASFMKGRGLLVCNEVHPARARVLSENIERMGIRNALVISHEPWELERSFEGYFDKILVDAPCSGEGMFRKNESAVLEWSAENVAMCAKRQAKILESAARMLKGGGRLVYSTCTFEREENEETIDSFLKRHPEFEQEKVLRLWPHKVKGEGHFLAALYKNEGEEDRALCRREEKGLPTREYRQWSEFRAQYLKCDFDGVYVKFGDQLYLAPQALPALKGLKVLRPGLHLGTIRKDRFEPSHALALALKPQEVKKHFHLTPEEAGRYLKGQTFSAEGEKGWYLITVDGYSLGWGKLSGTTMKNHYPKGLRK